MTEAPASGVGTVELLRGSLRLLRGHARLFVLLMGVPSIRAKALSRHKTPEQCFVHRVIARVVEDRSSETLTVNQLSADRSANHRYGLNLDHDSSIRIPA